MLQLLHYQLHPVFSGNKELFVVEFELIITLRKRESPDLRSAYHFAFYEPEGYVIYIYMKHGKSLSYFIKYIYKVKYLTQLQENNSVLETSGNNLSSLVLRLSVYG